MTLAEFLADWHSDNPCLTVRTSGATGMPKLLRVEKRRMVASANATCDALGLTANTTALLSLPLDYIAGKMQVVRALVRGMKLVEAYAITDMQVPFLQAADMAVGVAADVSYAAGASYASGSSYASDASYAANVSSSFCFAALTPMQVYTLLQTAEGRRRLQAISHLIIGGGAIDQRMAEQLRTFSSNLDCTFGMTETLSHIALRRLSGSGAGEWYEPMDGVTVGLLSDGCLTISAPRVCEEQLLTNDLAVMAADGRRFQIVGRRDNVINSGGIKIQIEEAERLLEPHIALPFAITKRSDEKYGEIVVMLYVADEVVSDDKDKADAFSNECAAVSANESTIVQRLQAICRNVLPRYWQPRLYIAVKAIPTTDTNKKARAAARALAESYIM